MEHMDAGMRCDSAHAFQKGLPQRHREGHGPKRTVPHTERLLLRDWCTHYAQTAGSALTTSAISTGCNYVDHNYVGHNYMGHNYIYIGAPTAPKPPAPTPPPVLPACAKSDRARTISSWTARSTPTAKAEVLQ